ncbi:MAG: methylmalonyl-CoA epimerase [Bdellovibrio sp.]|nr:methylmalonyl-CoA epimerase [Bdellovibrio sp.]
MIQLNHIGIAVDDLGRMEKLFSILGMKISEVEDVPEQGVRAHFLPLQGAAGRLELLEGVDPNGTIAKFLKSRGPGIHHLSFLLPKGKLQQVSDTLRNEGFRLIYSEPKQGAHQMRVNFIHPATCGGILIEVMEPS